MHDSINGSLVLIMLPPLLSIIVNPLNSFTILPYALPLCVLRRDEYAFTVLFTVEPLALV